ncbi:IS66 family transposase zinc-finger binding domain-containing protein [Paenibacillus thiaminolyticus]|uniref:IS66 family transposase n=1 Tax=Paenibacillus thiaminolyticus TaxID=49283 RepID=UPI0035A5FEC4
MNPSCIRKDVLKWYEEQFRLAQQKRFGPSSEKTHPDHLELNLFNEAEATAAPEPEPEKEAITYERRKTSGKHEADLSKLPVETVTYRLDEGEQLCGCCGGSLHEMTTETRREIAVAPPQVKLVQHVRQVCPLSWRTCSD